jgi:hypothetical protein
VNCGPWHVNCGPWRVNCGPWRVNCGPWHVNCGPSRVRHLIVVVAGAGVRQAGVVGGAVAALPAHQVVQHLPPNSKVINRSHTLSSKSTTCQSKAQIVKQRQTL